MIIFFTFPAPSKTQFISLKPKIPLIPEVTYTKPGNYPELFFFFNSKSRVEKLFHASHWSKDLSFVFCYLIQIFRGKCKNAMKWCHYNQPLWYYHSVALSCWVDHYVHDHHRENTEIEGWEWLRTPLSRTMK